VSIYNMQMILKYLDKIIAYYNFGRKMMRVRCELLNSSDSLGRRILSKVL
jgi:hypothetical protein